MQFFYSDVNPTWANRATGYSGLVVDVTGLDLERCSAPKIYDETGREIFGTIQAIDSGKSRAGANPLVIKAIGVRDHNFNIIISQADGDNVLAANKQSGFLDKCAVIIKKQ